MLKKVEEGRISRKMKMAPAPGFEPGTKWLTATYSTAELCRSMNISFSMLFNIYLFPKKANLYLLFFAYYHTKSAIFVKKPAQKLHKAYFSRYAAAVHPSAAAR